MNLEQLKELAFEDPEVKREYDKLEEEYRLIEELISMRSQACLTQEQVAERMKTKKSNISRLERGKCNPSWATLQKYASACGFRIFFQSSPIKR